MKLFALGFDDLCHMFQWFLWLNDLCGRIIINYYKHDFFLGLYNKGLIYFNIDVDDDDYIVGKIFVFFLVCDLTPQLLLEIFISSQTTFC